jgi:F0F1-type ATP synthase assembly protein I
VAVESSPQGSLGKDLISAGSEGWGFYASIATGALLGWGADRLAGTYPVFLAIGLVVGSAVAFWKLWLYLRGGRA